MADEPEKGVKTRGPKDHLNTRISHPSCKASYKVDTRDHVLQDLSVSMVLLGPYKHNQDRTPQHVNLIETVGARCLRIQMR